MKFLRSSLVIILFFPEPIIFLRSISSSRAIFLTAGPAFIPIKSIEAFSILGILSSIFVVLSGAVYIEMVFQWPGVGRMLVDAILKRDILLVQGGVVFVAACYLIFNIAVDVAQHLLDPRIKT